MGKHGSPTFALSLDLEGLGPSVFPFPLAWSGQSSQPTREIGPTKILHQNKKRRHAQRCHDVLIHQHLFKQHHQWQCAHAFALGFSAFDLSSVSWRRKDSIKWKVQSTLDIQVHLLNLGKSKTYTKYISIIQHTESIYIKILYGLTV